MEVYMKALQEASRKSNIKQENLEIILQGRTNNIRSVLKQKDERQIKVMKNELSLSILVIANTYTGANFDKPLSQENEILINECTSFVCEFYQMLSLAEIHKAFKMAVAEKFDINIETYYGKFNVSILGKVLKSYCDYRNKLIQAYEHEKDKLQKELEREEIERKNEITRNQVVKKYLDLKEKYHETGDEDLLRKIKPYWCKILIDKGHINLTDEQKKECWAKAKAQALIQLKVEYAETDNSTRRGSIKHLLKKVEDGLEVDEVNNISIKYYSIYIVQKSLE